jgi:D-alanyl-D-alanine carboxypeptidase
VEAVTGNPLARELDRCILGPLGLAGTSLPTDAPGLPSPASRGYSLPRGPGGDALDGPLLDVTLQNPSHAWAAGGLVSDLQDLTGFFRALLGGRLLPPGLLAEMRTNAAVPPAPSRCPSTTATAWGCWRSRRPPGAWSATPAGSPAS